MKTPKTRLARKFNHKLRVKSPWRWRISKLAHAPHRLAMMLIAVVIVLFFSQLPSGRLAADDSAQAKTVFSWKFHRSQDKNADRQPDGWRRKRDREHPSFIQSQVAARDPESFKRAKETEALLARLYNAWRTGTWSPEYVPEVTPPELAALMDASLLDDCYEVRMDGGAFELVSPRFDIDARYDYVLEAEIESQKLDQHQATVELRLVDAQGNVIGTYSTNPVTGSRAWSSLRTDSISIAEEGKVRGEICIRVQPLNNKFGRGLARFDNIQLQRMPTLIIKSNAPNNITTSGSTVEFSCIAAGLAELRENIELTITDIDGRQVYQRSLPLSGSSQVEAPAGNFVSSSNRKRSSPSASGKSLALFPVPFDQPGLYYAHARLGSSQRRILVAVLDSVRPQKGPFGLSLEAVPASDEVSAVLKLMQWSQASWVKLPVWYDSQDIQTSKATNALAKGLKQLGITTVGRLDSPPRSQHQYFVEDPSQTQSVSHLQDPLVWEPLLDPVISEINTCIDHIQLGSDSDFGFIGGRNSAATLEKVRSVLQYYFQDPKLVVASDWLMPLSPAAEGDAASSPYYAIHFSTRPQLTGAELRSYATSRSNQRLKLWTSIDPLPATTYSLEDRVVDLLQKMMAVKQAGLQAAFVTAPFDENSGLLDEQMLPNEILVPWVHIAAAIGARNPVGSIDLPQGSQNQTFQGHDGDVMIIWNSRQVVEELFFGENIRCRDIWGRSVVVEHLTLANGGKAQRISVGKWPVLVEGVDSNVVRWRQEFKLLTDHLTSHLSSENSLPVRLSNTFPKRAKGTLHLNCPSLLRAGERHTILDLEAARSEKIGIPLEFRSDASAGNHQLEFQFHLKADKDYLFSVQRNLKLGHPDIEFRWDLIRLNDQMVEARVELNNKTTELIDFDCTLFPTNQPYIRFSLTNCTPGTTSTVHRLRIPRSPDGQNAPIWIRCEQIRSPLTLNYLVHETPSNSP